VAEAGRSEIDSILGWEENEASKGSGGEEGHLRIEKKKK